jgi:cyclopropane fatty-acyl-phospholipid synthase-like methyltransferase
MVTPAKPHAPSCERNREPILEVLRDHFMDRHTVLEIGSGTGQHAVFFAVALPHLTWQCSDLGENLVGINAWRDEASLSNLPPPMELDANLPWPVLQFDAIFSANTLHIMGWTEVEHLFDRLGRAMTSNAKLIVYGPFNYGSRYTSDSNANFDVWLKERGVHQGIRDFEAVNALANKIGLKLVEDRGMPANNRCLVWSRLAEQDP